MLLQIGRAVPTTPWELVLTSSPETKFVLAILVGIVAQYVRPGAVTSLVGSFQRLPVVAQSACVAVALVA